MCSPEVREDCDGKTCNGEWYAKDIKPVSYTHLDVYKRQGYEAVLNYNAYVIGIHNYYSSATHVSLDFSQIAFSVKKSLKARIKKGLKQTGKHLPECIKERYGKSKQLKYVHNTALAPISFIQHKNPMFKKPVSYTHLDVYKRQA